MSMTYGVVKGKGGGEVSIEARAGRVSIDLFETVAGGAIKHLGCVHISDAAEIEKLETVILLAKGYAFPETASSALIMAQPA